MAARYTFEQENPYNVIASLIAHLRDINKELFINKDKRDASIAPSDLLSIQSDVDALFERYSSFSNAEQIILYGISKDDFTGLLHSEHYSSFLHMFEFLMALTRSLSCSKIIRSPYVKSISRQGFVALNDNITETGIYIEPRVKTINDPIDSLEQEQEEYTPGGKKKWADSRLDGINCDLANIYYIEAPSLESGKYSYRMRHFILEADFHWTGKKELLIAVAPIAFEISLLNTKYKINNNGLTQNLFSINGLKDEKFVRERIIAAYREACLKKVDILVFPEMLGSATIVNDSFFDELCVRAGEKTSPPKVILFPTWWEKGHNVLYVKNGGGRLICTQEKHTPFRYQDSSGTSYLESLEDNCNHCISVLHIPEIGRLTFPICRDLLNESYLSIMVKILKASLLLCPSFSPGKTQFDLTITAPIRYGCFTVWANTCAAAYNEDKHFDYIGCVSGPARPSENPTYLFPECNNICGAPSDACLFLIKISTDERASIECKHYCPHKSE